MKKPKDVAEMALRLTNAASAPLVAPAPTSVEPPAEPRVAAAPKETRRPPQRKVVQRNTVPVFLRLSQTLYEQYDSEAVRRTKATGRGVTVQQVILDRLAETHA